MRAALSYFESGPITATSLASMFAKVRLTWCPGRRSQLRLGGRAQSPGTGAEDRHERRRARPGQRSRLVADGSGRPGRRGVCPEPAARSACRGWPVGSGLADRFSDLELDCYWHEPPENRDRLAPIEVLGGQVEAFWEYDADEEEWSENY